MICRFKRCAAHAVDVPPEECELVFDDGRVVNLLVSAYAARRVRTDPRAAASA